MTSQIPHASSVEDVIKALNVNPDYGLEPGEATLRLKQYGSNSIETTRKTTYLQKFLGQFADVMILVLLAAAAISGAVGELSDTVVILIIVILNAIIGSVQEYRAEHALEALRRLTTPNAHVRRGGGIQNIPVEELVPGDIVFLEAGNIVPGDLRLFETVDLEVEEAALTGESLPVVKYTQVIDDADVVVADRRNMAFKGTHVTRGRDRLRSPGGSAAPPRPIA